jgi:hypothetical protein
LASDPLLKALARQSGLTAHELTQYVELHMITLVPGEVSETTLRRVRRIRRLRRDLGISVDVVAIIIRLLDRIQELEEHERRPTNGRRDDRTAFPL